MSQTTIAADPGTAEIVITHVLHAPRERVFNAFINPAAIPHWRGPARLTTRVDRLDPQPGGRWRFVQHDAEGNEYAFNGEFREVSAPERLSYTFEFEAMPGEIVIETISFEELEGETTLTNVMRFDSIAARDGMIRSGMESGARESMGRLAEYVAPD